LETICASLIDPPDCNALVESLRSMAEALRFFDLQDRVQENVVLYPSSQAGSFVRKLVQLSRDPTLAKVGSILADAKGTMNSLDYLARIQRAFRLFAVNLMNDDRDDLLRNIQSYIDFLTRELSLGRRGVRLDSLSQRQAFGRGEIEGHFRLFQVEPLWVRASAAGIPNLPEWTGEGQTGVEVLLQLRALQKCILAALPVAPEDDLSTPSFAASIRTSAVVSTDDEERTGEAGAHTRDTAPESSMGFDAEVSQARETAFPPAPATEVTPEVAVPQSVLHAVSKAIEEARSSWASEREWLQKRARAADSPTSETSPPIPGSIATTEQIREVAVRARRLAQAIDGLNPTILPHEASEIQGDIRNRLDNFAQAVRIAASTCRFPSDKVARCLTYAHDTLLPRIQAWAGNGSLDFESGKGERFTKELMGLFENLDRELDEGSGREAPAAERFHAPSTLVGTASDDMTWQEAAERMERMREQGEAFTSQGVLAKRIQCAKSTINKAIRNTPSLKNWAKRKAGSPRAQSLTPVVIESTAQGRELDPADDAAIRQFIEKAEPETKAWFLALPTQEQLNYLNDPDSHQKQLGRKP
jgi:hypothetical protein